MTIGVMAMKQNDFDWDKYLSCASYNEVRANSPDLSSRRPPTLYSPDRKWIYLSSQDVDLETNNLIELKSMLRAISSSFKISTEKHEADYKKLWLLRIDCFEVCALIANLVDDLEEYSDPDSFLGV